MNTHLKDAHLKWVSMILNEETLEILSHQSTKTALIKVSRHHHLAKSQFLVIVLPIIDLPVAFDKAAHSLLVNIFSVLDSKVHSTSTAWSLFPSLFASSSFSIQLLNVGGPQGSVLGPFLFSVCNYSLGHSIRSYSFIYYLYTENSNIYISYLEKTLKLQIYLYTWLLDIFLCGCQINISSFSMSEMKLVIFFPQHIPLNLFYLEWPYFSWWQYHSSSYLGQKTWQHPCLLFFSGSPYAGNPACGYFLQNISRIWALLNSSCCILTSYLNYCNNLLTVFSASILAPIPAKSLHIVARVTLCKYN